MRSNPPIGLRNGLRLAWGQGAARVSTEIGCLKAQGEAERFKKAIEAATTDGRVGSAEEFGRLEQYFSNGGRNACSPFSAYEASLAYGVVSRGKSHGASFDAEGLEKAMSEVAIVDRVASVFHGGGNAILRGLTVGFEAGERLINSLPPIETFVEAAKQLKSSKS